jgi:hypothetical protein
MNAWFTSSVLFIGPPPFFLSTFYAGPQKGRGGAKPPFDALRATTNQSYLL